MSDTLPAELARVRHAAFEPHTLFRVPAMRGSHINVAEAGFRHGATALPWPPVPERRTLFVFGGSMAFGYGLDDGATIPAQLEAILSDAGADIALYNFASLNHASTEERIRFERLLIAGHVPDVALFIDGFADLVAPYYAAAMHAPFEQALTSGGARTALATITGAMLRRATGGKVSQQPGVPAIDAAGVIDRYLAGMRLTDAAAQAFGVEPLFVWQPAPCYNWPGEATSTHTAGHADARDVIASIREGYALMDARRATLDPARFLWLADMQGERDDELYLDPDHYNAAFSREIAAALAGPVQALLTA